MEPIAEPHPSSSNSNYAFITHSQETIPLSLPPIDNATLARRRRRRTSAHDQAILEDEYRKCDRPDKTKRREIASRIQMGDKEVQIWFQNKRQSTRRKSKPLLPHEVIPNNSQSSSPPPSHTLSSSQSSLDSSQAHPREKQFISSSPRRPGTIGRTSGSGCPGDVSTLQSGVYPGGLSDNDLDLESSQQHCSLVRSSSGYSHCSSDGSSQDAPDPLIHSWCPSDSATFQETPAMTSEAHARLQFALSGSAAARPNKPAASSRRTNPAIASNPPRLLKRSSSSIRISTSLEGKATVVLDDPPSSPPLPMLLLPTSHHHPEPLPIPLLPTPQRKSHINPTPKSAQAGPKRRIIDSKIWEFYCDNQAAIRSPGSCRQAPIQPAEATQALGLVRSKSISMNPVALSYNTEPNPTEPEPEPEPEIEPTTATVYGKRPQPPSFPSKNKKPRKVITNKSSRPKPITTSKKSVSTSKSSQNFKKYEPSYESDKENHPPGAPVSPPPEPRRRSTAKPTTTANKNKPQISIKRYNTTNRIQKQPRKSKKSHTRKIPGEILKIPITTAAAAAASGAGVSGFYDPTSAASASFISTSPPSSSAVNPEQHYLDLPSSQGYDEAEDDDKDEGEEEEEEDEAEDEDEDRSMPIATRSQESRGMISSGGFCTSAVGQGTAVAGPPGLLVGRVDEMECVENLLSLSAGVWR